MQKVYEALIFIKPTLSDEETAAVTSKVKNYLNEAKAVIIQEDKPEKRQIAFKVAKFKEAINYYLKFNLEPKLVNDFRQKVRITEHIIRGTVIRVEEKKKKAKKEEAGKEKIAPPQEKPAAAEEKQAEN
jgi:ribosomal protein S6